MPRLILLLLIAAAPVVSFSQTRLLKLTPNRITLTKGRSVGTFTLNLPKDFGISVAAEGLKRVRFMAKSPDGRIFVTDMFNLTDNNKASFTFSISSIP